jgi:hypothetical protein
MTVKLILDRAAFPVAAISLSQICRRFANDPPASPYRVTSVVPAEVFKQFLRAIDGCDIEITEGNASGLLSLSSEFGFSGLSAKLATFGDSPAPRLTELKSIISAQSERIDELSGRFERLEEELGWLRGEVAGQAQAQADAESATKRELQAEAPLLRADVAALRDWAVPWIDSQILTAFPAIFDEFRGRSFRLLWRGSRDGLSVADFHRQCDGRSPTLTIIRDTGGSIFGGFTPIAWETVVWNGKQGPEHNGLRADESLKSFVFTLKNPHNTGAMRFPLRRERQNQAVYCATLHGPAFGKNPPDLSVRFADGNCSNHTRGFGQSYDFAGGSVPGIDPKLFMTGEEEFTIAEIEVFEIAP